MSRAIHLFFVCMMWLAVILISVKLNSYEMPLPFVLLVVFLTSIGMVKLGDFMTRLAIVMWLIADRSVNRRS